MKSTIDAMKSVAAFCKTVSEVDASPYLMECAGSQFAPLAEVIKQKKAQTVDTVGCLRCNTPKKCAIYGCSPNTWPSENTLTAVTEQSAFEDWLNSPRPSGNSESVQYQWSQSSELADYIGSTTTAPDTEPAKPPENCGTGHCSCIECLKPAKPSAGEREGTISSLKHSVAILNEYGLTCTSELVNKAANMLAADALEIEQTCNCRFVGEINTVQCTLHNAWAETLNEQSGYRKELAALKAQQGVVPHGWKLAPIDPTKEMIEAGQLCPCYQESGDMNTDAPEDYRQVYKAMLAATPQPPQAELRVPMTSFEMETASRSPHTYAIYGGAFKAGIRAAEIHHGIGVKS